MIVAIFGIIGFFEILVLALRGLRDGPVVLSRRDGRAASAVILPSYVILLTFTNIRCSAVGECHHVPMNVTSTSINVVDVASRARVKLDRLGERWTTGPRQVAHLREAVGKVWWLLERTLDTGGVVVYETQGQELVSDLMLSYTTLRELEGLLQYILLGSTITVDDIAVAQALRARWSAQKRRATELTTDLKHHHQRIHATLSLLNMCGTTVLWAAVVVELTSSY